jgi:hypothetical protein
MRNILFILWVILVSSLALQSQGIAVGTDTPNAAAIMELESTDKGILIPRLTTTERNAIVGLGATQEGLLIFNSTGNQFNFWDGSAWVIIPGLTAPSWVLSGNSGTVEGTDFIGTTDNIPINFKVNNEKAGRINSNGQTFYGYQSGNVNTATSNTGIGFQNLFSTTTGNYNIGIGVQSLYNNLTASNNFALGYRALYSITAASDNIAIGNESLYSNTTGRYNIALGHNALRSNTIGFGSIAIGYNALSSSTVAGSNIAIGRNALAANTTASFNIGIGFNTLAVNSTGDYNTAIGNNTLEDNTLGDGNIAIGSSSLRNNTTGDQNIGIGGLLSNTIGEDNVAVGIGSLAGNLDGNENVAVGFQAINLNESGEQNTAIGTRSMLNNNSGNLNAALGYRTLYDNLTGNSNVAVGSDAFRHLTTGEYNVAVGYSAGVLPAFNPNVLNYTTFIGYQSRPDASGQTNVIGIAGNQHLTFGGNNRVRIGNNSMSSIGGQVGWSNLSDERIKENIVEDVKGLEFILKLRPVTYNFSIDKSNQVQGLKDNGEWEGKYDIEKMKFSGFLAQEVDRAAKEIGYDFSGVDKSEEPTGLWGLRYAEFTVPLVKAVQELHELNAIQQQLIEEMRQEIELLKSK